MGNVSVGTVISRVKTGNKWMVAARITMSSSYATGGDTIDPAKLGLSRIECIPTSPCPASGSAAVHVESDYLTAPNKVKAYLQAGGEVSNATNLSTFSTIVTAIGV